MKAEIHITVDSGLELIVLSEALSTMPGVRKPTMSIEATTPTAPSPTNGHRRRLNKVTRKMARSLIRQKISDKVVAKQIGVSPETIRRLRLGLTWKR